MLPAALLREIAAAAGVHIYVESDDTVYANRSLLSLVVNRPGPRTIRLPRPATVDDLFSGETVVENAGEFEVDMPQNSTRLWRVR
jgi:hypothetical protein